MTSTIRDVDKESRFKARLKAAEEVMDEALERYMRQLRKKGLLDVDLDIDQGEELTDTGVMRDNKEEAGDEEGLGRSSWADSVPASPARDKSTIERQWKFLCDNDIIKEVEGSRPEGYYITDSSAATRRAPGRACPLSGPTTPANQSIP